ncbi:MAG: hypothetical protein KGM43_05275 [Planctomycetota bacterium]|nr:hypothetical protein [Planctomycetota bacterium]
MQPRDGGLKRLLEQPGARPRIGRAVASLMGVGIVTIGVLGVLLGWHLKRRARLIRERLGQPRRTFHPSDFPATEPPPEA